MILILSFLRFPMMFGKDEVGEGGQTKVRSAEKCLVSADGH